MQTTQFKPEFIQDIIKIKKEVKRAIDDFCDRVSNCIALKDIVPISLTQYNDSDVIHTLLHYINLFSVSTTPNTSDRTTKTLKQIQQQFLHKGLIFSATLPVVTLSPQILPILKF